MDHTAEYQRLLDYRDRVSNWKHWGPYLSERAWGTVREDYSPDGSAWDYFPHDHARSRVYRWNEDGLAGISDRYQYLCFALALWNGQDSILKERLFGLTGPQGNHGEDVKEYYYYLDSTPTHSYMKMLYKYPQAAFPYADLIEENERRGFEDDEYELIDTGIFADDRYFDVVVEYAKANQDDLLIKISLTNRGPEAATCQVLPTLWYRNTWGWGYEAGPLGDVPRKPQLHQVDDVTICGQHPAMGRYHLYAENAEALLFTENETNRRRLYDLPNETPYVKDAFHRYIIEGDCDAVNPDPIGTKAAALYRPTIEAGQTVSLRLRLTNSSPSDPFADFDAIFAERLSDADAFYNVLQPGSLTEDEKRVQRQALAGMLWSKQFYYYDIEQWLNGDPAFPPPAKSRRQIRNHDWTHLNNYDLISMPDKWEYPWYAVWDLAFHCLPLTLLDADFAKRQLELMTREWYMHPNGQLPAYEWSLDDVNPPVHAWATWQVFHIDACRHGQPDYTFLKSIYLKLLLNFTWWINRKDEDGNNIFQGGFLGLDNISLFDRSATLPTGGHIDQSDGTAWMGFFSLVMMKISLELARQDPVYQDTATKFFEHFLAIATAMTNIGGKGYKLWDEEDGFFYDVVHLPDDTMIPLKVRSMVGLVPLLAVEVLEPEELEAMPDFDRRMHWFMKNRPHLTNNMASVDVAGFKQRHLVAIVTRERLISVLRYMLDEDEFLSPYGIRSLSKAYETPYQVTLGGQQFSINYQPGESRSGLFGGNSNWRGPVWFPLNYLLIESLRKFHAYYCDDLKVECPTGSGNMMTLEQVADELSRRLTSLFLRNETDRRPFYGNVERFQSDPHWRDLILFNEYFHGDSGLGLGAAHQTGWTGLVAELIQQTGTRER